MFEALAALSSRIRNSDCDRMDNSLFRVVPEVYEIGIERIHGRQACSENEELTTHEIKMELGITPAV